MESEGVQFSSFKPEMSGALSRLASALVRKAAQYLFASLACVYLFVRWLWTGGEALKVKERTMPRKLLDDYNHKYILLPSGINMHYVEAGDPTAPLMVMVHGFPEFWYSWRFQIAHFKDRFRVVAIDQRGYGDSSKPSNIADYDVALLVKDLDDLIHGLGYESAVVMAHDWGGIVAWLHAIAYPQSVSRLIICNIPHPAAFFELRENNLKQKMRSWYILFFQTPRIPEAAIAVDDFKMFEEAFWGKTGLRNKANLTADDMEAWKYTFSKPDSLRSALNYYRCAFQDPDKKMDVGKCTVKTLIVWGEEDTALIKEGATLSVQWCDDATLHFVPGASHWVQQDEPAIVNAHIDRFLQSSD